MKKINNVLSVRMFVVAAVMATLFYALSLTGCSNGTTEPDDEPVVITIAFISGVTAPATGANPVTAITETAQYTGTVTWYPAVQGGFAPNTVYTAIIIVKAKTGYTLQGVGANFFTVAGAASVSNDAGSGVVTAVFPKTAGTAENPAVIDLNVISGVTAPVTGVVPVTAITGNEQYNGTVIWSPSVSDVFAPYTVYTATINLTAKTGFTLQGVEADFFTVAGAESVTNDANSGVITAVFPSTAGRTAENPAVVDIKDISIGDSYFSLTALECGEWVRKTIIGNEQYSGIVTWSPSVIVYTETEEIFAPNTVYTATITLTARTGYTFQGVGENFFNVEGATSVTNAANSGVVTAVFPETNDVFTRITFGRWLYAQAVNTPATAYTIKVNISESDLGHLRDVIRNNPTKYVILDLSESTLTNISYDVFSSCTNLTGIIIPNGVISIANDVGNAPFANCTNLTSVTIPNSVTYIGDSTFYGCSSLASVTIPNRVTNIGKYAFRDCSSLADINIPDSVTTIGYWAFSNTAWLNNQPDGLVYAGKVAYMYKGTMPANASILLIDGTKSITDQAFYNCTNLIGTLTIPNSVTYIGDWAFLGCSGLTTGTLTIPNSVTTIGKQAFYGCRFTSVTIGSGVTSIGEDAFVYGNLTEITVDYGNTAYSSQEGILYNKNKTTLVRYPASKTDSTFTIPNSVTSIESDAFYGCSYLTSVIIPNSVTSIGSSAFYNCSYLTSVIIPDSVTSIGWSAFVNGTRLTSVTFQGTITSNNFGYYIEESGQWSSPFHGDLRDKYLAEGIGTYTRSGNGTTESPYTWTKQP